MVNNYDDTIPSYRQRILLSLRILFKQKQIQTENLQGKKNENSLNKSKELERKEWG